MLWYNLRILKNVCIISECKAHTKNAYAAIGRLAFLKSE